jgi:hypothetical protein
MNHKDELAKGKPQELMISIGKLEEMITPVYSQIQQAHLTNKSGTN